MRLVGYLKRNTLQSSNWKEKWCTKHMCLVDRSYLWQRTAKCLLWFHKTVDRTLLFLTVLAILLPLLTSKKKENVSSNYGSPYSSYEWSVLQEVHQQLNETKLFLKNSLELCFSFVTLIKYFKFKITAADINLAIKNKWHMAGHGNLFHSTEKDGRYGGRTGQGGKECEQS